MLDDQKYSVCRIFIASPSDVETERRGVEKAIMDWNTIHSEREQCILLPVGYENVYPIIGFRPQTVVNHQCLDKCDLLVAIFWCRIGKQTGDYLSGTVEEIERHRKAGKPAMLYISQAEISPDDIDVDQITKLKEFINTKGTNCYYKKYPSAKDFEKIFYKDLEKIINEYLPKPIQGQSTSSSVPAAVKEEKASFSEGPYAGDKKPLMLGGREYTFCWCPATDSFMMGGLKKEIAPGFWMLETPVTQRLWKDIMGYNPSKFKGEDRPVEYVSWNDCQEFIKKLNSKEILLGYEASLPSEA